LPSTTNPSPAGDAEKLEALRRQQDAVRDKYTAWTPTELPAEYAEKLKDWDPTQVRWMRTMALTTWENKQHAQVMDYTDARRMFWKIITRMAHGRHVGSYVVDEHNLGVIPDLIRYMIMDPACGMPLHKGILLHGPIGTGKTYLMHALKVFADAASIGYRQFALVNALDVANRMRGNIEALYAYQKGDFCFDDIGQEPQHITHFGDKLAVMEQLIGQRYDSFTKGKNITHMTSNLQPHEIQNRYGSRVFDRIREMFTPVLLPGKSRRI
jgi:DNA replication protein DnaC